MTFHFCSSFLPFLLFILCFRFLTSSPSHFSLICDLLCPDLSRILQCFLFCREGFSAHSSSGHSSSSYFSDRYFPVESVFSLYCHEEKRKGSITKENMNAKCVLSLNLFGLAEEKDERLGIETRDGRCS